jgi:signal transduction histidine kinase
LVDLVLSDPALEVVGAASDADEAIALAGQHNPDVVLVDVRMPGGGGSRAARMIRELIPNARVIALSAYEDRSTVMEMLRAGAIGYVVKGTPADEILSTIHRAIMGQASLSTEVTGDVIQELVMLLERSEEMAAQLQALDRMKRETIQILSHELFTPITAIQGAAATLADHPERLSPEAMREMATGVGRAGDRLKRLVGNLSASARLDREGVELPTGPLEVRTLLDGAVAEFPEDAQRIEVVEHPSGLEVWADRPLAVRALVVVIENGLALSRGRVEIAASRNGDNVDIEVRDRGPGLPDGTRDRLFEPFTQEDPTTRRHHQGMGIGLFLAKRIMVAHSGGIVAEPRDGGGAVLRLTFPVAPGSVGR